MSIDRGNENKYRTTIHGKVAEGQYKPKESAQKIACDYLKTVKADDVQTYAGFMRILHRGIKKIYPPFDTLALALIAIWLMFEIRENYPLSMSLVLNEAIGAAFKLFLITVGLWLLCKHIVNNKMAQIKDLRALIKENMRNSPDYSSMYWYI